MGSAVDRPPRPNETRTRSYRPTRLLKCLSLNPDGYLHGAGRQQMCGNFWKRAAVLIQRN